MPKGQITTLILFAALGVQTHAAEEDIRTTYNITSTSAVVTTAVKNASMEREKLMRDFLFPMLAQKLQTLPMVTGVEFNSEVEPAVSSSTYMDYWEYKRSFPAMVRLALPAQVTLMIQVEEVYRVCKSPAEKAANATQPSDYYSYGGRGESSSASDKIDCTLSTSVKVKGPHAIYGNFASSVNLTELLREKQSIGFEINRGSDKTSMNLVSRFSIDSEFFDRNLFKFLEVVGSKIDSREKVVTRNNLLLGTARVLRISNEKVVGK